MTMTLLELITVDERELAARLRASRTVSEEEAMRRERLHDRDHWTPAERSYGSVGFYG
jgi:hypothetical protein